MNRITLAQREALDVVKDMIDKSNTDVPDYGTKIITLILGILNVDYRVEHTELTTTDITDIEGGKTITINPDNGNNKIHINIPDWGKPAPIPPFVPGDIVHPEPCPYPPQVWYNQEPDAAIKADPLDAHGQEDRRYATEVSCTGDKDGIVYTTNTADARYNGDKDCITTRDVSDCTTYTGDFRDVQTSFNDK